MRLFLSLLISFLYVSHSFAQLNGVVTDQSTGKPLYGVKIYASTGEKQLSDFDGKFSFSNTTLPLKLVFNLLEYRIDTVVITNLGTINHAMRVNEKTEQTVVVSANKRAQKIEEIPISLEVIKPRLIENKGMVNLEQAVEQTPGVFTMDGQVSIRGGSGFAYGAGSRVMMLFQ